MFLDLQERLQLSRGEPAAEIDLPMDRSDVAGYLGLTLPAVSRAFRALTSRKVIACREPPPRQVLNRRAFAQICDAGSGNRFV